jgi:hypothetical protein
LRRALPLLLLPALAVTACGSPDRAALARQTVQTYWSDIGHAKMQQAYNLLTPGNQAARPFDSYSQDMFGFLTSVASVYASVGSPAVKGDFATVPVTLHSPKFAPLHAYQHLFWQNNQWYISDQNGGLTKSR